MNQRKVLKEMLEQRVKIMAPGAYDAWSARLVEKAGFPAVYMTGYGLSASVLGKPDIGLLTMTEMVNSAKNIAAAVNIPVIADADNGYGGVLNVVRTVQEYEQAGVAAVQLEDQVMPKRCGHMEGKEVIPMEEMVAKIKSAIYARKDPDLVLIARTDARAVISFEEALKRAKAYEKAGADVIFFEAPQSVEEMEEVAHNLSVPLLANMVEKGKTPMLTATELQKMGYPLVIYPGFPLFSITKSLNNMLDKLKEFETSGSLLDELVSFTEFNTTVGLHEIRDLEKTFMK